MITQQYVAAILAEHPSVHAIRVVALDSVRDTYEYGVCVVLIRDTPSEIDEFRKDTADFLEGLNISWRILSE